MRTKLSDRKLPVYSKGEEIFNMVSHIVGGAFGFVVLVMCVAQAAFTRNYYGIVASAVYGTTMIMLYTMSSIYHGLTHQSAKKIFQILDHCAIYFLIAGTYMPISLSAIRPIYPFVGWGVFIAEWVLAAIATTLTAIDLKKYEIFAMICYIAMGWMIIIFYPFVVRALTFNGFLYMLAGGILYTVGAVLYGVGKKKKYAHNVFHVFVLLGSFFHFLGILLYAL